MLAHLTLSKAYSDRKPEWSCKSFYSDGKFRRTSIRPCQRSRSPIRARIQGKLFSEKNTQLSRLAGEYHSNFGHFSRGLERMNLGVTRTQP